MASLDDTAVDQNHSQIDDPIAHGTMMHCVGARAIAANHSSNLGTGRCGKWSTGVESSQRVANLLPTWIHREEQTDAHLLQLLIQGHPLDARLNHHIHIFLIDLDDLVHVDKVHADTPKGRSGMSLQTAAAAVGDNGNFPFMADASDCADLVRIPGICHSNGQCIELDR